MHIQMEVNLTRNKQKSDIAKTISIKNFSTIVYSYYI